MARKRAVDGVPAPMPAPKKTKTKKPDENGETPATSRPYTAWKPEEVSHMLDWLEIHANYDLYKAKEKMNSSTGRIHTTGLTKTAVYKLVSIHLKRLKVDREWKSVKNKFQDLETTYKEALKFLGATGEGITDEDLADRIRNNQEKIEEICPRWERLNPIFRDQPNQRPPHVSDNTQEADAAVFLLGARAEVELDPNPADGYDEPIDTEEPPALEEDRESVHEENEKELNAEVRVVVSTPPRTKSPVAAKTYSVKIPGGQLPAQKGLSVGEALQNATKRQVAVATARLEMEKEDREKKNLLESRRLEIEKEKFAHEKDQAEKDREERKEIREHELKKLLLELEIKKLGATN